MAVLLAFVCANLKCVPSKSTHPYKSSKRSSTYAPPKHQGGRPAKPMLDYPPPPPAAHLGAAF